MRRSNFYYLFAAQGENEIRLDYPQRTIRDFISKWNKGKSINEICFDLKINHAEFVLITVDLSTKGEIKQRTKGIYGGELVK